MYTKMVPYTNYHGKPMNKVIHLNLDEREILAEHLSDFRAILTWRESLQKSEDRILTTDEVQDFYTALESILLGAWGVPSDDGEHFHKNGVYDFKASALFNATMMMFLSDPVEANKMIDELMPKGFGDMLAKAEENLEKMKADPKSDQELLAEIERLRAQVSVQGNATGEIAATQPPQSPGV